MATLLLLLTLKTTTNNNIKQDISPSIVSDSKGVLFDRKIDCWRAILAREVALFGQKEQLHEQTLLSSDTIYLSASTPLLFTGIGESKACLVSPGDAWLSFEIATKYSHLLKREQRGEQLRSKGEQCFCSKFAPFEQKRARICSTLFLALWAIMTFQ